LLFAKACFPFLNQCKFGGHDILPFAHTKANDNQRVTVNKSRLLGIMTPAAMIDALLECPYSPGNGEMHGADCWGIVELWYLHVLEMKLEDRSEHPPGHDGMQSGFDAAAVWEPIETPADHCLVIMRAGRLIAGHVGVYFKGSVLHSSEHQGCTYQPISDRWIKSKTTGFLKHESN